MSNNEFLQGVEYPHPFDELAIALAESAARYVCILSPALDPEAFDNADLVGALSALARSSRQTTFSPRHTATKASIHIRKLAEHPDWNGETIVIRDRDGVLYKPGGSDHDGFYEPDSRASTQGHLELFDELWRYSVEDPDLRHAWLPAHLMSEYFPPVWSARACIICTSAPLKPRVWIVMCRSLKSSTTPRISSVGTGVWPSCVANPSDNR